jgi:hypothetical protein
LFSLDLVHERAMIKGPVSKGGFFLSKTSEDNDCRVFGDWIVAIHESAEALHRDISETSLLTQVRSCIFDNLNALVVSLTQRFVVSDEAYKVLGKIVSRSSRWRREDSLCGYLRWLQ